MKFASINQWTLILVFTMIMISMCHCCWLCNSKKGFQGFWNEVFYHHHHQTSARNLRSKISSCPEESININLKTLTFINLLENCSCLLNPESNLLKEKLSLTYMQSFCYNSAFPSLLLLLLQPFQDKLVYLLLLLVVDALHGEWILWTLLPILNHITN